MKGYIKVRVRVRVRVIKRGVGMRVVGLRVVGTRAKGAGGIWEKCVVPDLASG